MTALEHLRGRLAGSLLAFLAACALLHGQEASPPPAETAAAPPPAESTAPAEAVEPAAPAISPDEETSLAALLNFASEHHEDVEGLFQEHQVLIFEQGQQAFVRILTTALLILAFLQGLTYVPSAYVASLFLAPLRASWTNAGVFAGIQFLVLLLSAILAAALTSTVAGWQTLTSIFGFIQLIVLVGATMRIYDIGLGRTILFGIVGMLVQTVLLSVGIGLVFMLMGWGGVAGLFRQPLIDFGYEGVLPALRQEIEEAEPVYQKHEAKMKALQERLDAAQKDEAQLKAKAAELQSALDARRQAPDVTYAAIGALLDDGKLEKAKERYRAFAEKHPDSPLTAQATAQADALEESLRQDAAVRAKKEEERRQQAAADLAAFQSNLAKNRASLSEIRRFTIGKTRDETIALLGPPSATATNLFVYRNIMVRNPLTEKEHYLLVRFHDGLVQGVAYGR